MNRYSTIGQYINSEEVRYRRTTIYPTPPASENDTYIITTSGDRYDTLALQFYGDITLWWIIAAANNFEKASLAVTPGVQLRIPGDKSQAIKLFEDLNKLR